MIILFRPDCEERDIAAVERHLIGHGLAVERCAGGGMTILAGRGEAPSLEISALHMMRGIAQVVDSDSPYKRTGRQAHPDNSLVRAGSAVFGCEEAIVIAGPCAVESAEQFEAAADAAAKGGARMLRGGAYKPRTSPYSFQGLGEEGLRFIRATADRLGLPFVSEVMTIDQIAIVGRYADMLQVGARSMHNYPLLAALGSCGKPVLLKRGFSATIHEWLLSAEYILAAGNPDVVLCERGIRTFESKTRNTLDLSAVPVVKSISHLPVIVDPSHSAGDSRWVSALARAAVAAGADGLMVEVHPSPATALSDGAQALLPDEFARMMDDCRRVATAVGRVIAKAHSGK